MDTVYNQKKAFWGKPTLLLYFLLVLQTLIWIWSGYLNPEVEEGSRKPFKDLKEFTETWLHQGSSKEGRGRAAKKF